MIKLKSRLIAGLALLALTTSVFTYYEIALGNIILESNKYKNYFVVHNRNKVDFKNVTDALYYVREAINIYNETSNAEEYSKKRQEQFLN